MTLSHSRCQGDGDGWPGQGGAATGAVVLSGRPWMSRKGLQGFAARGEDPLGYAGLSGAGKENCTPRKHFSQAYGIL